MSRGKTKFIIYKISDDKKRVVVEDVSDDADWEVFRTKLADAKDAAGNPAPRYATYDVQYEIPGEGQRYAFFPFAGIRLDTTKQILLCRSKIIFISWVPQDTPTRVSFFFYLPEYGIELLLTLAVVHALRHHSRGSQERRECRPVHPRR